MWTSPLVSEGLLLVARMRPHLGLPAVKASPSRVPLEAPGGLTNESSILKRAHPPVDHPCARNHLRLKL